MKNGRFSNDLVTSNVDLNVILAKNDSTNDKKVTKQKKNFMIFPNCHLRTKFCNISNLSFAEKRTWNHPNLAYFEQRNYVG